ncbi:helix-turn-helix domain-containing protein [Nocardiopsis sp. FR4]|uniref:helix-turn-helix domain-containing protein n=1 Tax=Nocardiopsis sp. FR4 TaxID=2605985 RepID=UPI00135AB9B4|nr:helix-turn-helix transcriptional regulator [Nocardiopsis sp. FR4]
MTDEQANDFGVYIRELREAKGWGVRELARQVQLDPAAITKMESGRVHNPRTQTLRALATALSTPFAEILSMAACTPSCHIPCIGVHLRLCYSHLPEETIRRIEDFANQAIAEVEAKQEREMGAEDQF